MNADTPTSLLSQLADEIGGALHEVGALPDGSGFATMSFPLREDHWLYETTDEGYTPNPTYPMLAPSHSLARQYLDPIFCEAVRYGVKCATMNGREEDFDPDALVGQARNGLLGLHTETGLCGDPEDSKLFDPPNPGSLSKVLLEALSLALNDGLIEAVDLHQAISAEGIRAAVARENERLAARQREIEEYLTTIGAAASAEDSVPAAD